VYLRKGTTSRAMVASKPKISFWSDDSTSPGNYRRLMHPPKHILIYPRRKFETSTYNSRNNHIASFVDRLLLPSYVKFNHVLRKSSWGNLKNTLTYERPRGC
jgi:hypothetical protein